MPTLFCCVGMFTDCIKNMTNIALLFFFLRNLKRNGCVYVSLLYLQFSDILISLVLNDFVECNRKEEINIVTLIHF